MKRTVQMKKGNITGSGHGSAYSRARAKFFGYVKRRNRITPARLLRQKAV